MPHMHSTHAETEHHVKLNDNTINDKLSLFMDNMLGICLELSYHSENEEVSRH
jgi:hypothetical protein